MLEIFRPAVQRETRPYVSRGCVRRRAHNL